MKTYTRRVAESMVDMYYYTLTLEQAISAALHDSDEVNGDLLVKSFGYDALRNALKGDTNATSIYGRITGAKVVGNTLAETTEEI